MNILTIIILAIFLLCAILGYKKGFLKTMFSLVSWIIVLVLCHFMTPIVTDLLIERTQIDVIVQTGIDNKLDEILEQKIEMSKIEDLEALLSPEMRNALLGEGGSLQDFITDEMVLDTTFIVQWIVGVIGFVFTLLFLRIVMFMIEKILGIISKLPLLGFADKILGLTCGVIKGLVWTWIVLTSISVVAFMNANATLASYISQSQFLLWLQEHNILLSIIANIL